MDTHEPKVQVSWHVVSTIMVWLISALIAWGVVQSRIAVLEDRYDRLISDVTEMKADIKTLLRQVR